MKEYRVTISDETLAGTKKYLRYIANAQGTPLTAIRWWDKAVEQIFSRSLCPIVALTPRKTISMI